MWGCEGLESRVAALSWSGPAEVSAICRSTLPCYAMVAYTEELWHVGPLRGVEGFILTAFSNSHNNYTPIFTDGKLRFKVVKQKQE